MITIDESFPSFSESYLYGQDIFWEQFNEVSFYIEDTELEELYHQILKKIFPDISIEKIFPLNGKQNVINCAKEYEGAKNRIFIVDKDFDDLHNRIENISNLFYLDRYCIENYLFEEVSVIEFVVSENPKIRRKEIKEKYSFEERMNDILNKLLYVNSLFYIVQHFSLPFENSSLHISRFLQNNKLELCQDKITNYKKVLNQYISENDLFIDLEGAIEQNISFWKESGIVKNNICGKSILFILLQDLKKEFNLKKMPEHYSACYRLARECRFETLHFLRDKIVQFVN